MNYIFLKKPLFTISFSAVSISFYIGISIEILLAKTASSKAPTTEISKQIYQPYHYISFKQRITCQEIIEKIYWNHRIWPKENKQPKPDFNSNIPERLLINKVVDYLKKSNALEYYWDNSITANQLQAEMERMAKS